jgi:hypothetical protein
LPDRPYSIGYVLSPIVFSLAITIDKSQGMTVGPGHVWEYLVVMLPPANSQRAKVPGVAQVAITRVTSLEYLALLSSVESPLTRETLSKVGTGEAVIQRKRYEEDLYRMAPQSQSLIKSWILELDSSADKTFDGGYNALVSWYRSLIS